MQLLKVRIEDRGHKAKILNLTYLPRVTRASVTSDKLICDGINLLEVDTFYLKELAIREPFFHVMYSRELWAMLRERYLAFAEGEPANTLFIHNLLAILADKRPMINPPAVYGWRTAMPYQLYMLARNGSSVPPWSTHLVDATSEDQLPISLDEPRTIDVLFFPKGQAGGVRISRQKVRGRIYWLTTLADRFLEDGAVVSGMESPRCKTDFDGIPPAVIDAASGAAKTVGLVFGQVAVAYSQEQEAAQILQVDPSFDFRWWENEYRLTISEPLAEYLTTGPR